MIIADMIVADVIVVVVILIVIVVANGWQIMTNKEAQWLR